MKKNHAFLIFFTILCFGLSAKTLVFPFQLSGENHASLKWLGKAFSFYLTTALEENFLPVFPEKETDGILQQHHIRFPFAASKATAITLASLHQASNLVWGIISFSPAPSSQMEVRIHLIDLAKQRQTHLASIRGDQKELLNLSRNVSHWLLQNLGSADAPIRFPRLHGNTAEFEKLIKSLLVKDPGKKIELLSSLDSTSSISDFGFWETAKARIDRNEYGEAEAALQKISSDSYFRWKKEMLLSLVDLKRGELEAAVNKLQELQQNQQYSLEVLNNIGVVCCLQENYPLAGQYFHAALNIKKNPDIWFNRIHSLQHEGNPDAAKRELHQALRSFPDDERLLGVFCRFLSEDEEKDAWIQAFEEYIPGGYWKVEGFPDEPVAKNPFVFQGTISQEQEIKNLYLDARNLFFEGQPESASPLMEQALEINPFLPENHHLLGLIHLSKADYRAAELSALAALYLERSEENHHLLKKVYDMAGLTDKAKAIEAKIEKNFPGQGR